MKTKSLSCKGCIERGMMRVHRGASSTKSHSELWHADVGAVPFHECCAHGRGPFDHVAATTQDTGIENVGRSFRRI